MHCGILAVGPYRLRLTIDDAALANKFQDGHRAFLAPEAGRFDLDLRVEAASVGPRWHDLEAREDREGRRTIEGGDFRVTLDPSGEKGILEVAPEAYSLDSALKALFLFLTKDEKIWLLHASALTTPAGRAAVFPGVSGAGKTTIVKLAGEKSAVHDELTLLTFDGERPVVETISLLGGKIPRKPSQKWPVLGFFFPIQSRRTRFVSLTRPQTALKLAPNIMILPGMRSAEKTLEDIDFISRYVSGWEMEFEKNDDFYKKIIEMDDILAEKGVIK